MSSKSTPMSVIACLIPFSFLPTFPYQLAARKFLGKKLGPLGEASILGMECITRLLENIFVEPSTVDDRHADVPMLRKNDDFVYYITTVAHVSLSQVRLCSCS